jgi:hypothetical protein
LALRKGRDGIVNIPEHFHNALLYEKFNFLNPDDQGRFERLTIDLSKDVNERGLAAVSWAIYLGFLTCGGEREVWSGREQVFALSQGLSAYFGCRDYRCAVEAAKCVCGPYAIKWEEAESYCLSAVLAFSNEPASL